MKLVITKFILLFCVIFHFGKIKSEKNLNKKASKFNSKNKLHSSFKKNEFEFLNFNFDTKLFSKFYTRNQYGQNPQTLKPVINLNMDNMGISQSNDSLNMTTSSNSSIKNLRDTFMKDMNNTFVPKNMHTFKKEYRNYDFKLLDKQLEEIFGLMLHKDESILTLKRLRSYTAIFLNNFQKCDLDRDNVLSLKEFTNCMQTDPYLTPITPPPVKYASYSNYSDPNTFYAAIFKVLDDKKDNYLNFVGYMNMRLYAFTWKECSISAPFIEEVDFECALEYASGYKSEYRTSARNIYKIALELSNNPEMVNLDFVSYIVVANTVRLFGKINGKEDNDVSRREFNMALDDNTLPMRYNQDIINQIFKLVEDSDRPNQGLDLQSFIYYDYTLQLFSFTNKKRAFYINLQEFIKIINDVMFPFRVYNSITLIPQYKLSRDSYQMYEYYNITNFEKEESFLFKFLELNSEVKTTKNNNKIIPDNINNNYNVPFKVNNTISLIFKAIDTDADGWLNFFDFGQFMQISYIFTTNDKFSKGSIPSGQLFEIFRNWADYPVITFKLRESSNRFNLFDQNNNIDLLSTIQILKIFELVSYYSRNSENNYVYEIELKKILSRVNMDFLPEKYITKCLRGVSHRNLPRYDWECAFVEGMNANLLYFESMNNYREAKTNNLTLTHTTFYNVDPNYT